jgi:hypothetical protein
MTRAMLFLKVLATWGAIGVAHAQQPIEAPLLNPFADNRDWVLFQALNYRVGDSATIITVPKGFVTDFASIPQAFWTAGLSPNGKYSKAAIVHDYLYWTQGCTRQQADNILLVAMKESDVDAATRTAIYDGVRLGGDGAWQNNAAERAMGLPRIVPDAALEFGPLVLWPDYRRTLAQGGVGDPPVVSQPAYCAAGDTTEVPGRRN